MEIQVNETFKVLIMDTSYGTVATPFLINKREEGYTWKEFKGIINEIAAQQDNVFDFDEKSARYKSKDKKSTFALLEETSIPQKDAFIVIAPTKMSSGSSYKALLEAIKEKRAELGIKDSFNPVGKSTSALANYLTDIEGMDRVPTPSTGGSTSPLQEESKTLSALGLTLGHSVLSYFSVLGDKVGHIEQNLVKMLEEQASYMEQQASDLTKKAASLRGQIIKITAEEEREAAEYFNSLK